MRKGSLLFFAVAAMLLVGTAFGQSTIVGSDHDFSSSFGAGQICVPCHTPHDAYPYAGATIKMVLWNHEETTQTFQMYVTQKGHQGTPDGPSLLCLSCHDGVTAMDNYGGKTNGTVFMTGDHVLGTDLTDDHPIGIEYLSSDPDYQATPQNGLPLYDDGTKLRVECTTCHDPHGAGFPDFLRDTTSSSQICLDCHIK